MRARWISSPKNQTLAQSNPQKAPTFLIQTVRTQKARWLRSGCEVARRKSARLEGGRYDGKFKTEQIQKQSRTLPSQRDQRLQPVIAQVNSGPGQDAENYRKQSIEHRSAGVDVSRDGAAEIARQQDRAED